MSRSWIVLATLVALSVASAGCGGKSTGDAASAADGQATGRTGVGSILGVVVDDAIRPLADVNVTANGPSGTMNTTTGADGEFRFDGLAAGVYLVQASKPYYIAHLQAVTVVESVEPKATRFLLTFEASSVPYATLYKVDGFYECGAYPMRVCSNVNIATSVVLCAYHPSLCLGNVTQDRSLFFQWVEPGLDFLQTEMFWEPTTVTGTDLGLLIGGGTEEELRRGVNVPAYNGTEGPSPLMLRLSNHEAVPNWCSENTNNEDCESPDVLNRSKIGVERALLVQVDMGPTFRVAESCGVSPCGTGFNFQQPYTLFITAFYGYEPPLDWLFSTTGELPPPPT